MSQKVDQVTNGIISIISGAFLAMAGLLALLYALIVVVADSISPWTTEPWVAPLIVGVVFALIGLGVLQSGRKKLLTEGLKPRRTMGSFKRDKQVLRDSDHERTDGIRTASRWQRARGSADDDGGDRSGNSSIPVTR